METKKVNTGVAEVEQAVDACQTNEVNVLDAFIDSDNAYRQCSEKIEVTVECLFDCIKESLKDLDDLYWNGDTKAVIDWGCYVIDHAPWYEDDPNHISGHISKDLWKGYVMGFNRGCAEGRHKHDAGFCYYCDDDGDIDNYEIVDEDDLQNISDMLADEYNINIRLLPHDEYEAYTAKKAAEQQEWNACVDRCRESGDYSEMRQMMGIDQPEEPAVKETEQNCTLKAKSILETAFGGEWEAAKQVTAQ